MQCKNCEGIMQEIIITTIKQVLWCPDCGTLHTKLAPLDDGKPGTWRTPVQVVLPDNDEAAPETVKEEGDKA